MRAFASQLIAGQNHSDREPVWDMPIVIPEPDPAQFAKLALARSREMAAHEITVEMITDILVELGIWSDRQAGRVSKYASAIVQKVESRLLPAADDAAGLSGKAMSLPVWRAIDALRGSKLLPSEIEAIVAVARSCGI